MIRTEVGWAGKNVTKMFRVHVFGTSFLDVSFELLKTLSPSLPAGLHITVLLHGNNTEMIFFVDPDLNKSSKKKEGKFEKEKKTERKRPPIPNLPMEIPLFYPVNVSI